MSVRNISLFLWSIILLYRITMDHQITITIMNLFHQITFTIRNLFPQITFTIKNLFHHCFLNLIIIIIFLQICFHPQDLSITDYPLDMQRNKAKILEW